ncbi:MAG: ABC transporter substrate-binding protein [Dehalococcoidia bacterium]|nr:ABC transporter substrate-binding protein [Dehalococcoidia bacterium]
MFKSEFHRVSLVAAIGAMLLTMAACGPAAQPAEPAAGSEVKAPDKQTAGSLEVAKVRGGKLLVHEGGSFGNPNDPHLVATSSGRAYAVPAANGLLTRDIWDPKAPMVPDLAKSWEVSKDGKSYTFKLREGIKFHNVAPVNGREFTSEDAKYTLLRLTADPSVIVEKWKPRFQRAAEFPKFKSLDTPDKYTLVVNLTEPYAPILDIIAHPGTLVIPREFVEKFPEKIILEGMVGTGPFMTTEFKNQQIAGYKKNPDYWKKDPQGGQLPYLDELSHLYFADATTALASFRAGQLDIASPTTKSMMDNVKKDIPGAKTLITPKASLANFRFNSKFKPFQDVMVRRALHLVVDRHQIADLITEGLGVVSGPVTTPVYPEVANTMDWLLQQPGYRKDKAQDIAEAKRLMKEAGYEAGFELRGLFPVGSTSGDLAAILADQLKVLNVKLKPEQVDYAGQWVPRSTNGEFEISNMTHTVSTDVDSVLAVHVMTGGSRNYGAFSSPSIDELVKKTQLATVVEERRKYAQEAEKLILEEAPLIFLYTNTTLVIAQPWVHNAADGPIIGHNVAMSEKIWVDKH